METKSFMKASFMAPQLLIDLTGKRLYHWKAAPVRDGETTNNNDGLLVVSPHAALKLAKCSLASPFQSK
jgi:hypothetical protein